MELPTSGPARGHSRFLTFSFFLNVPDDGGSGEGKPKSRRRGTRGGRAQPKKKATPAASAADAPAAKPRRRGTRGGRGRRKAAADVVTQPETLETSPAQPIETPTARVAEESPAAPAYAAEPQLPVETTPDPRAEQMEIDPRAQGTQEEIDERAMPAPEPAPEARSEPAGAPPASSSFVPGPPRVGMRPAVIRPAPGGRMSFSKGNTRQQFRPGGFRPARGFAPHEEPRPTPPQAEEPATAQPESAPAPQQPLPMPQRGGHQHPQHRGPMGRPPQPAQNRGGRDQRGQQRGQQGPGQQGGQRGGQQGGGGRAPQQGGQRLPHPPERRGPQPGRSLPPPPPPAPVQRMPAPPAPIERAPEPVLESPEFVHVEGTGAPEESLAPTPVLQPTPAGDAAALAPFAEDIEIDETEAQQAPRRVPTGRDMLINVVEGEEVRIAVVRRGLLEELYMERSSTESHIGNIYKGRVTNVEPSIQAAFIDFGIGKNGFLHISDLHPQYFPKKKQPKMQTGRRTPPQYRPQPASPAPSAEAPAESTAETSLAHQQAGEYPAVQVDDTAVPQAFLEVNENGNDSPLDLPTAPVTAEDASAETNGENGNGIEAGSEAPLMAENGDAPPSDDVLARVTQADAVAEGAEAAADAASEVAEEEVEEDQADFGSAYGADFGDDDSGEGYDEEALDDGHMKPMEKVGRKTPRRDRPPIQQCLRRGQEVIVQVTKEGIGTKGPTLTSYVSCPGRYLVMMPGMAQLGVSRKIEDLEQRRVLKRTLQELNPPRNLGFIIRTAGTDVAKKELQGDLNYLVRMWKVIANRIRTHKAPVELYEESDLVIRTIRDVFNDQIDRIIVDNEQVASRVRDFLSIVDPRAAGMVELYTGTMPLFQKFGVEREIEKINSRRVELNNGGSLVIDSTEALVAIDVNSGRYREMRDAELTAFNMNKEALKEVVRQLRLRDLGGVIVIDFIDMREERHKRAIEDMLRKELENDRAKTKVLRMSQFCMIEMTRQRVRPSLKRSIYMDCPHCHGSALIKTPESVSLDVMRRLAAGMTRLDVSRLEVRAYPTVATFLLNRKRKAIVELEDKTGKRINISPDEKLAGDQIVIQAVDGRGVLLNVML